MLCFYLLKRKLIKAVHSGKLKFGKVKNHWKILLRWQSLFTNGVGYGGGGRGGGEISCRQQSFKQLTKGGTPTTDSLKCNHCSRLCCSHAELAVHQCLLIKHLTVSQSTSPAMDCRWWLKWTIVNWLLMRRGIKKYRSHLDHSHFLAPQPVCLFSLSVLITCSCYFLFIWLVYEIFKVLVLHPPPLPRWDVSPLQVTPPTFHQVSLTAVSIYNPGWREPCESRVSHPRAQHSNMSKSWTQSSRHLHLTP